MPASIPLIGCGGISSGADALAFARAGASAVQIYTAFGYDGVGACRRIKDELSEQLAKEGTTWSQLVSKSIAETSKNTSPVTEKSNDPNPPKKVVSIYSDLIKEALSLSDKLDVLSRKVGV